MCCVSASAPFRPRPLARYALTMDSIPTRRKVLVAAAVVASAALPAVPVATVALTPNDDAMCWRDRAEMERSSRQGRSLAGCKSPYRQLPVFRRLAYPMRGEATNRVLLGRKSPGCPAVVFAAVGTTWGASKLGGRNITKYLHPRKSPPHEVVSSGIDAGSRPTFPLGKADDTVEETGEGTRCTAGVGDPASKERFSEITSGSSRGHPWAAGTAYNLPRLFEAGESPTGVAHEPVGAMTEG